MAHAWRVRSGDNRRPSPARALQSRLIPPITSLLLSWFVCDAAMPRPMTGPAGPATCAITGSTSRAEPSRSGSQLEPLRQEDPLELHPYSMPDSRLGRVESEPSTEPCQSQSLGTLIGELGKWARRVEHWWRGGPCSPAACCKPRLPTLAALSAVSVRRRPGPGANRPRMGQGSGSGTKLSGVAAGQEGHRRRSGAHLFSTATPAAPPPSRHHDLTRGPASAWRPRSHPSCLM